MPARKPSQAPSVAPGDHVSQDRFHAIDAMRGVAALGVVLFHLTWPSPMHNELRLVVPHVLLAVARYGQSGVAIFFVISGFVIAYSTRSIDWDARAAGRFILRRQVRLDPPYYAVIALTVVYALLVPYSRGIFHVKFHPSDVPFNVVYLQTLFDRPAVVEVSWTLCLEIQFYLCVLVVGVLARRLFAERHRVGEQALVLATGAASLVLYFCQSHATLILAQRHVAGTFVNLWWMFVTGVVVCWHLLDRSPRWVTAGWFAAVSVASLLGTVHGLRGVDTWGADWFTLATGLLFLALVSTGRTGWEPPRVLLYLGRISYSLYLVHYLVIVSVMGIANKLFGAHEIVAVVFWFVTLAVAIAAASLLQHFVEGPAMRLSSRFKVPRIRTPVEAEAG